MISEKLMTALGAGALAALSAAAAGAGTVHNTNVTPDVIFGSAVYDEMVTEALNIIDEHNNVDAKGLRDRFNTSRKYAIGLLEHLDSVGITRRVGDARVRGPRSKNL